MLGFSCGLPWLQVFWADVFASHALLTLCVCAALAAGQCTSQRMPLFAVLLLMRRMWPGCDTAHSAHMDPDVILPILYGA